MSTIIKYLEWTTRYYLNVGSTNHWLQMKLIGPLGNPQAIVIRPHLRYHVEC